MTGDCVLVAEMGATTVGSTAVDVVTAGRDYNKETQPCYSQCL